MNAVTAANVARAVKTDAADVADDALLDPLQHAAFNYFLKAYNPRNGLVSDTTREGAPCSIAVIGFALSAYPVGVERAGWHVPMRCSALS